VCRKSSKCCKSVMNSPKMTLINKGIALKLLKRVDVLSESQSLALDIGGSLAKIIYFQPDGARRTTEKTDGIPKLCIDYLDPKREGSSLSVRVPELNVYLRTLQTEWQGEKKSSSDRWWELQI